MEMITILGLQAKMQSDNINKDVHNLRKISPIALADTVATPANPAIKRLEKNMIALLTRRAKINQDIKKEERKREGISNPSSSS